MRRLHVMRRFSQVAAAFLRLIAVAGPALLALLTALYIGRPSPFFLVPGITLAVAILACDVWIIARRRWITGILALMTQIAFLIFLYGYSASPLPEPAPLADPRRTRICFHSGMVTLGSPITPDGANLRGVRYGSP